MHILNHFNKICVFDLVECNMVVHKLLNQQQFKGLKLDVPDIILLLNTLLNHSFQLDWIAFLVNLMSSFPVAKNGRVAIKR